jgi:hypothetical protein
VLKAALGIAARSMVLTPVITGLNAAHGLLFMPASPGSPELAALLQTLSQIFIGPMPTLARA